MWNGAMHMLQHFEEITSKEKQAVKTIPLITLEARL